MTEGANDSLSVVRRRTVVLCADVVGYCRLMARDDERTVAAIVSIRSGIGALARLYDGRLVDAVGDNLLIEFCNEKRAVYCAISIQRALWHFNRACPSEHHIQLRIGLHSGDVLDAGGALYGSTVNISARLQAIAEPGAICLSLEVAEKLDERLRKACVFVGPTALKNIPDPVRTAHLALPV